MTPFPPEWELRPRTMLDLVILGIIGMDGFRYAFVEYAKDCWFRCHPQALLQSRGNLILSESNR